MTPSAGTRLVVAVLLPALGITALQVALACALTPAHGVAERYRALAHWDCGWYASIVRGGYNCPEIGPGDQGEQYQFNVGFFPGHPAAAWLVGRATGLSPQDSVQLAAQLACVGFWSYLLLFLRRWGVPGRVAVPAVALIASHPAAFFLVTGYSESLFLMTALGYFYWSARGSRLGLVVAALHGFVMSSSRLVGAPLVVVPFIQQFLEGGAGDTVRQRVRRLLPATSAAAFAACGALAYFAYCRWRFGHWDVYMATERAGWGVYADYAAFFHKRTYWLGRPRIDHGWIAPQWFDHLCVPCVLGLLAGFAWVEWRAARSGADTGWRWRAGLYAAVVVQFYLGVTGRSTLGLAGLIRYAQPIVVLFVLAGAHIVSRVGLPGRRRTAALAALLAAWASFGLVTQMVFVWRFARGLWVA